MTGKNNFSEIFTLHKDKIYNLSFKMTGDSDIAEDITQETFLKCYENIDKFRGDSSTSTWLYTIAKNACLQFLKREKRTSTIDLKALLNSAFDENIEKFKREEKNNYIQQVKEGCLLGLLRTLTLNQRLAFILHVLHKQTIEDTSKILNKSENATRTLIHRARKNIKEFVCGNCSLYNTENPCKCEGMINFSLKKGWVKYDEKYPLDLPTTIISELNELRKIAELYITLPNHETPASVFNIVKKQNFLIFSEKKVK